MKNLTWQNPEQLFVAQELINKVKSKCCGIKDQEIIGEKEVKHIYFQCVEYLPKDSGYQTDTSIFYYNYDCLAEFIKSKLEKNKI